MKVVLVHPSLGQRGGAEKVVNWMARSLRERGDEVSTLTLSFEARSWPEAAWRGLPVGRLPAPPRPWLLPGAAKQRWPGRRLAALAADADLLVCHNYPATLWTAEAVRRSPGPRTVWLCEEPPARLHWRRSMPRVAEACAHPERYPWLAEATRAWQASDRTRRTRRRQRRDLPSELAAVRSLDRAVANSGFCAATARAIYGRPFRACLLGAPEPRPARGREERAPYVAWVTSPALHKNALGFLEALRVAVHERGARNLRVRVVGLDRRRFGPLLARAGLEPHVALEPRLGDAEVARLLASSRLVAVPPLDEPFGLVAAEAMALARPVLASSVGGPAETVVHGETGLHAHPLDPGALADALLELWNAPGRCEALGAAGRARYQRALTFERFMERFLDAVLASGEVREDAASAEPRAPRERGRAAGRRAG